MTQEEYYRTWQSEVVAMTEGHIWSKGDGAVRVAMLLDLIEAHDKGADTAPLRARWNKDQNYRKGQDDSFRIARTILDFEKNSGAA